MAKNTLNPSPEFLAVVNRLDTALREYPHLDDALHWLYELDRDNHPKRQLMLDVLEFVADQLEEAENVWYSAWDSGYGQALEEAKQGRHGADAAVGAKALINKTKTGNRKEAQASLFSEVS